MIHFRVCEIVPLIRHCEFADHSAVGSIVKSDALHFKVSTCPRTTWPTWASSSSSPAAPAWCRSRRGGTSGSTSRLWSTASWGGKRPGPRASSSASPPPPPRTGRGCRRRRPRLFAGCGRKETSRSILSEELFQTSSCFSCTQSPMNYLHGRNICAYNIRAALLYNHCSFWFDQEVRWLITCFISPSIFFIIFQGKCSPFNLPSPSLCQLCWLFLYAT